MLSFLVTRWASRGQKVHRPSPIVITLRNLSNLSIFGLSGFTKKVCGPVKKLPSVANFARER